MTKKSSRTGTNNPLRTIVTGIAAVIVVIIGLLTNQGGSNTSPTATVTNTLAPAATNTQLPTNTVPPTTGVTQVANAPSGVTTISIPLGFGAQKNFWQVFFTAPSGSRDAKTYVGGIDTQLAAAINGVQRTLDIAAFEFNNEVLTKAILDAKARGVVIRIVTDDDNGIKDTKDKSLGQFKDAGIPIVDDSRGAFMHNKFMILDSAVVWTGSWNYTVNDTYRNNNNAISLRSQKAVQDYQTEFNELFEQKKFGPRSPANTPFPNFTQDGTNIQIYFSPEDKPLAALIATLNSAQSSVRFMTFSFTDFDAASALMQRASAGVSVQGIFETTGSDTPASELKTLFCAGLTVRQDGNPFILHHKVFIVDDRIVITGSFNISTNAADSNDENMLIITDPDFAALYIAEFNRRWAEAKTPTKVTCS